MPTVPGRPGVPPGNEFATDTELAIHAGDTTSVHGITNTATLVTTTTGAALFAALDGGNTLDGSQRLESSVTSEHPLTVWADKGDSYGLAERFTVENTPGGGGCDVNFRNVDINVGDDDADTYEAHLKFYGPPSATIDTVRIFEAGSTTALASKLTNTGTFVSYAKGAASGAAFSLSTWGDANPTFAVDADDGDLEWGAGGGSAVDTTLYRDAAGVLRTDGTIKAPNIGATTGNLNLKDSAGSTAVEVRTTDVNLSKTLIVSTGLLQLSDGVNVELGTSTGTRIGRSTSQKLGFYNATPVVRPSGVAVTAEGIHAALVTLGLISA